LPRTEFRQAISHAVDREAFAETVFLAAAVPIHGPVTPGNQRWFWPDLPRYEFSRERARALLASIGLAQRDQDEWLEDARGTDARFTVLTFRGNTTLERGAAVLRDDLRQIGIAVDVVPLESGALIERLLKGDFEAIFFNFTSTDLDPAMQRDFWWSSGSAHVWNIGQQVPATDWERQIDDLMTKQVSVLDEAERRRLFNEVQRIFAAHLPVIYFAAPRPFMGVSGRLGPLEPGVTRPYLLWSADTISVTGAASGTR
jgi:peptide/nickel transport system substrate-binding protein